MKKGSIISFELTNSNHILIESEINDASGIFNVATGKSRSFNDVANSVIDFFKSGYIEYIEFPDGLEKQYQAFTEADMTNLYTTGFDGKPTELEDGVKDYLSFLDSNR